MTPQNFDLEAPQSLQGQGMQDVSSSADPIGFKN